MGLASRHGAGDYITPGLSSCHQQQQPCSWTDWFDLVLLTFTVGALYARAKFCDLEHASEVPEPEFICEVG